MDQKSIKKITTILFIIMGVSALLLIVLIFLYNRPAETADYLEATTTEEFISTELSDQEYLEREKEYSEKNLDKFIESMDEVNRERFEKGEYMQPMDED